MDAARTLTVPVAGRASGVALAIAAMTAIQLGAALSEPLFDRIGAAGTVALRLALAALILWPFARPRLRGRSRADLGAAVALGRVLGPADAVVLRGDLAHPARRRGDDRVPRAARRRARRLAPGRGTSAGCSLAGAGVALLTLGDGAGEPLDAVGVAFALVAAVCWASYILLTKRVGARWAGFEGLSVSLVVAALVSLPVGVAGAGAELLAPSVLLPCVGLALLVPLVPYAFELVALRRLPTALFGVIMSLEPAIAALLGFLVLDQELKPTGIVAIAMVSIASAGATLSASEPPLDEGEPPCLGA